MGGDPYSSKRRCVNYQPHTSNFAVSEKILNNESGKKARRQLQSLRNFVLGVLSQKIPVLSLGSLSGAPDAQISAT